MYLTAHWCSRGTAEKRIEVILSLKNCLVHHKPYF
jgi:hypothetical protein